MKPDVKKIIADIKATKGNRKFCNGLAGTLQDDNYASSICKYVKTVTPERIDLLIEYAEKLEAEVTDMAVQLANAESKCRALAAENGRYSMSAGQADQRMSESRAVRSALGFQEDADDVSPSDLVEKIQSLITEQEMLCSAHPQPLGPIMDSAIDAFNSAEMPETGMLNAFFILRDSIIVKTPATDAFLAEVRAQGVEMYAEHLTRKAIASGENKNHAYAYLANNFAAQLRKGAAL
ncbi:hypothetical protein RYZ59_23005 [Citrobacter sp. HN-141]|uniref:hypothetical protein n=1 Tax=unclassified Citrobacter TaxID=2644389 RepID=UPI002963EE84|nr:MULTISPECIES: hypothetical protein [unclassified Citrobacter]MDW2646424.1 hypothetical protein [Citrobacter sp. HN-141]MDW2655973.1 hypothetical protein [Citrobacter sp. HN-120]MDW2698999.1 hypothetical protein [Citrobacter sp. HN-144]